MDKAVESIASTNACVVSGDGRLGLGESVWCPLSEGSMRPVSVVVLRVLADDDGQVALSGDQDVVGCLAPA